MVIDSLELSQISIGRPMRQCMNPGSLSTRIAQCVSCTDKAITFLSSAYPQLPFDINIALVQTRYRGDWQPRTFPNFHCRPYMAVYEHGYLARPYSPVHWLHRQGDYIFRCSIPTATFWYKHCYGARTVPWWSTVSNIPKFPLSALYGGVWTRVLCPPI